MLLINNAYANESGDTVTIKDSDVLPQAPAPVTPGWTSFVPMILVVAVFYFFLFRPQEKRRKAHQAVLLTVKKGEEVLTNSGIIGTVSKINDSDNTVFVEVAGGLEIKMLKTAIADILSRSTNPTATTTAIASDTAKKPKPRDKKGKKISKGN